MPAAPAAVPAPAPVMMAPVAPPAPVAAYVNPQMQAVTEALAPFVTPAPAPVMAQAPVAEAPPSVQMTATVAELPIAPIAAPVAPVRYDPASAPAVRPIY